VVSTEAVPSAAARFVAAAAFTAGRTEADSTVEAVTEGAANATPLANCY
jgi:hypothetical protein